MTVISRPSDWPPRSPRQMKPEELGIAACIYVPAYSSRCNAPVWGGGNVCPSHSEKKCSVRDCDGTAVRECSHTGQFVCGAPLCPDCEEFTDLSRSPGTWGFMNHGHRRKAMMAAMDPNDIGPIEP